MAADLRQAVESLVVRVRTLSRWHAIAASLTVAYTVWLAVRTTRDHFGLGTSAYDFGLYDQGIWLLSQGKAPFVTLMGRNLFGDHTSFILLPLVPLYWVISSTGLLFVVQAAVLGLGALPVWKTARMLLGSLPMSCVAVVAYLLHPALTYTGMENFHPDSALAPLIAWAIYAALAYRWAQYAGAVVLFGGLGGLIKTSLTRPDKLIRHLVSGERPLYLLQLLAPVGFMALVRPEIALLGTLPLLSNLVSTFWYQSQIRDRGDVRHLTHGGAPAHVAGVGRARRESRLCLRLDASSSHAYGDAAVVAFASRCRRRP
ncbi:MAG: DUF2079 domain-containing protein [Acidimicrobiia bacterium]|nr:DUF2079 domain-containing protein [Acidimicrobiia bacterium]